MAYERLTYVITSKEKKSRYLTELLESISRQRYPKYLTETLIITEGTSESAKAIGIRKAKGDVVCILASDNLFNDNHISSRAMEILQEESIVGCFPRRYTRLARDKALSRYFALIGGNDPLAVALGKADRDPYDNTSLVPLQIVNYRDQIPTLGDNGFFIKKDAIMQADLDHYYHIDVCEDLRRKGLYKYARLNTSIWHRTGNCSLLSFFRRRARFGAQHAFNRDRRWHLVERRDFLRLLWFVIASTTLVFPTIRAIKGYMKVRDRAWALHPIVCFLTVLTYALVVICLPFQRLKPRLSSAHTAGRRA